MKHFEKFLTCSNRNLKKKAATTEKEVQGQQHTENELASKVIETLFSTFVQTASHDTASEVRG